jgi:hypothetical protein
VPDERSLRLNNAHGYVITEPEGERSGEGNAGRQCRASEDSTFHREKEHCSGRGGIRQASLQLIRKTLDHGFVIPNARIPSDPPQVPACRWLPDRQDYTILNATRHSFTFRAPIQCRLLGNHLTLRRAAASRHHAPQPFQQ